LRWSDFILMWSDFILMWNDFILKWSDFILVWSDFILKWSDFILKLSEVSYGEVLGDKITMCIRVTLNWGYLIVLWLFNLVRVLYCVSFNLFRNVLVFC
jgi:hypothetical protein